MQNPVFLDKKPVGCTGIGQGCIGTGHAVGNLYRYRSRVYRYKLCSG